MDKNQATALAATLATTTAADLSSPDETWVAQRKTDSTGDVWFVVVPQDDDEEDDPCCLFVPVPSTNNPDVWAVAETQESDTWLHVSPDLCFPTAA